MWLLSMCQLSSNLMEHDVDHLILQAATIAGQLAAIVGTQYIESHYFKTPYHTSILSGQGWVQELLDGHLEHICNEFGVHWHVFLALIKYLQDAGQSDLC